MSMSKTIYGDHGGRASFCEDGARLREVATSLRMHDLLVLHMNHMDVKTVKQRHSLCCPLRPPNK